MTDRFEEAVRQAAQGLESPGPVPSYEGAWKRGRRRRVVKQAGMACAGALVLIAALTVNLGRGTGSDTSEVDEVVVGIDAATPTSVGQAPVATTPPVPTPTSSVAAAASAPEVASSAQSSTVEQSPVVPTATPVPSETTNQVAPVPVPTAPVVPSPTADAPLSAAPTPSPVPTADTAAATVPPTPEPTVGPVEAVETPTTEAPDTTDGTTVETVPADATSEPETAIVPQATATSAERTSADAVVLDPVAVAGAVASAVAGGGVPCDTDGDGDAEATCNLLADYACASDADRRAGYQSFDTDADGRIDTCIAVDITICDTTGDGLGDTPCIIELKSATE